MYDHSQTSDAGSFRGEGRIRQASDRRPLENAAKGATAVECGHIVALIAAVIITAVSQLGTNVSADLIKVAPKIH